MKISFHGAAGGVTGSCYKVTCGPKQFLVDCGMFQGSKSEKNFNYQKFPFDPKTIDFVLLTHAHIDHIGLLPKLVKNGFKGPIYGTGPTIEMAKFLLPDSAKIQESEVQQKNRRNEQKGQEPLVAIYSLDDANKALALMKSLPLGQLLEPAAGVKVFFRNAGHVLGSAFLEVTLSENGVEKKVVFSGDLGSPGHPIVKDPETFADTDVLLLETTYGNRLHTDSSNADRLAKLAKVIRETIKAGGNLIVPSFAFERTQDLMHDFMILMDRGDVPEVDVVVDSPLAINATEVFAKFIEYYDDEASALLKKHGSLFKHPRFSFTRSAEESMALKEKRGIIILSSSGMCDAGRIKYHLKQNLWKRESTILIVGFQAEGTLGRLLLDGEKVVRIHGEEIRVKARIEQITGYSGHADQNGLLNWLSSVKTIRDRVFLVHGEEDSRVAFAKLLEEKRGFRTSMPKRGEVYDLTRAVRDQSAAVVVPTIDSFNLYAGLTIKLADFMRTQPDEAIRRKVLEKLAGELGR